jgi:acyl-CoA thioesterase
MKAEASVPDDATNRRAEEIVAAMMASDAFSQLLGMEVVAAAPGSATVRMKVREDMVNGLGVCHGGVTFSLADSALAFASNGHGKIAVSIENSLGYPAPVRIGDIITATAEEESASRRLAYYRVSVTRQDGTKVGIFRGSWLKHSS